MQATWGWTYKNNSWAAESSEGPWLQFKMDAIESEPGTPETTRIMIESSYLSVINHTYFKMLIKI